MHISVVIPVLNRAHTLPRLFASLVAMEHRPVEIILVDNGSTDGSQALCQAFRDERQAEGFSVVIATEAKPSASAARNRGASLARGEYLYFFDSDDEIDARFLSDAQPYVGRADMICGATRMLFADGTSKVRAHPQRNLLLGHLLAGTLSTQSFVLRRELWAAVSGWNETLRQWDDWEFALRLLLQQPAVVWLSREGYHCIYQHAQGLTGELLADALPFYELALAAAHQDIADAALSHHEKTVARTALCGKRLLLAQEARRQGQMAQAEQLAREALSSLRGATSVVFRIASALHRYGAPAVWRIYYIYCLLLNSWK